ncbi:MAG: NAD(P)/FAD-dependent oxidoreductase [bacterium]|nr:MAG: NAD(P)/FAD-dependent oxidoreductase [bacterium]
METERFDAAVIGAGPAGSWTARRIADRGYRVLLLEKRDRIGYPVRCAEAVGPRIDVERFIPLGRDLISSPVDGFLIVAPGGQRFEKRMPGIGFTIDRELFDRRLAEAAQQSGAVLRTGHQAMGLTNRDGAITGLRVKELGTGLEYASKASVVVGADGVEALSPRWAGLAGSFKPDEIFSCAQELITGIEITKPHIEFHLGSRFAPGGYAWVFPKGMDTANVGVGFNPLEARGKRAVDFLDTFIAHRCPGGTRTRLVIGGCDVARGLPALATNGYVTVGEAARQNNPFSGGGIINALEGAEMAAETIVAALRNGDTSARSLAPYTRAWRRSVGRANGAFYLAARIFFELSDAEMDRIMRRVVKVPGVFDEKGIKPVRMVMSLVAAEPSLLVKVLKSVAGRLLQPLY